MKPYCATRVQVLQPSERIKWVKDFLKAFDMDWTYPDYIVGTDEAIFHLDGHVNLHNAVTWGVKNPHAFLEVNTQKKAGVMVWAGLIKDRIVVPFLFDGSVTGNAYLQLLQQNVWPAIQRIVADEEDLVIFQQDGASAHYYM